MIEDISDEKRMKSTMSRYIDPGIADKLMGEGADIMGGQETTATLLFSDVRGFTTITESLGAQGTVALLNEYFDIMVEAISEQEGMVDKFIGDAVLAVFGAPLQKTSSTNVLAAIKTAIALQQRLAILNRAWIAEGQSPWD